MGSKTERTDAETTEGMDYGAGLGDGYEAGFDIADDFDTETEYVASPLIPRGTFHANVTDVKFDSENQCIIWVFCLADNGGVMSDGKTSVDGVTITYKNWLPKPGDADILTASGKMTKRQAKINMLTDFGKDMKINVKNPEAIINALRNGEWIGLAANLIIGMKEYEGRTFNEITKVKAA